jgi:hypothetical protein
MTSSTFPAVSNELDQVLANLVRDYIDNWYQDISTDTAFSNLLLDALSSLTLKLEDAILRLVNINGLNF